MLCGGSLVGKHHMTCGGRWFDSCQEHTTYLFLGIFSVDVVSVFLYDTKRQKPYLFISSNRKKKSQQVTDAETTTQECRSKTTIGSKTCSAILLSSESVAPREAEIENHVASSLLWSFASAPRVYFLTVAVLLAPACFVTRSNSSSRTSSSAV